MNDCFHISFIHDAFVESWWKRLYPGKAFMHSRHLKSTPLLVPAFVYRRERCKPRVRRSGLFGVWVMVEHLSKEIRLPRKQEIYINGWGNAVFIPTQQQHLSTLLPMKLTVLVIAIATVLATAKAKPENLRRAVPCEDIKSKPDCLKDPGCVWDESKLYDEVISVSLYLIISMYIVYGVCELDDDW